MSSPTTDKLASDIAPTRTIQDATPWIVIAILVALPILFNALTLFPEVKNGTPNSNDEVFHYLFIERANQAISAGDNPFDHWLPELELGFPQFLYYQNLPHLTVVLIYRVLLRSVSLLRLLNLVRYLLLVLFPLTVYWSMRRMDFSSIAAAVGAAFSSMLSSQLYFGFDFNSYVWRGFGMFPQLCSMHLMFVGAACVRRAVQRGKGYAAAIITSSAIVLSDLLYGYIFAIVVAILWLLALCKKDEPGGWTSFRNNIIRSTTRLMIVAVPAFLITAYQTVPFFLQIRYLNGSGSGESLLTERSAFGASDVLVNLASGHFFDNHRLPGFTVLVAIGILYAALKRRIESKLALAMLITWTILYFGPDSLGLAGRLLPLSHLVYFVRFISGVDFGAILTAGLGGEFLWAWCRPRAGSMQTVVPLTVLLILLAPALVERWNFYQINTAKMESSDLAFSNNQDVAQIISALRKAGPGRVYAGTRFNWGRWMKIGNLRFYDLLPIEQFDTLMPWQSLSLNAPYLWRLNIPNATLGRLYNIRYLVAPKTVKLPGAYHALIATPRYVLYQNDSYGYLQLGEAIRIVPWKSNPALYESNRRWLNGQEPLNSQFNVFLPPGKTSDGDLEAALAPHSSSHDTPGHIYDEIVTPDSISARVVTNSQTLLVFKVSYHPNWRVAVDGHEQRSFMVSPSFLATEIAAGSHQVQAEYRSSKLKRALMVLALLTLLATVFWPDALTTGPGKLTR